MPLNIHWRMPLNIHDDVRGVDFWRTLGCPEKSPSDTAISVVKTFVYKMLGSKIRVIFPDAPARLSSEVGGIRLETSSRFVGSKKRNHLWASICWYMRETQRGTVSSNSRFQTVPFQQYSANPSRPGGSHQRSRAWRTRPSARR